jgi:hypothetical protein
MMPMADNTRVARRIQRGTPTSNCTYSFIFSHTVGALRLKVKIPAELGRDMPAAAGQVNRENLTRRSATAAGAEKN